MTHNPNQPIGYWLKLTDKVLTEKINEAQTINGVTRFAWQLLNTIDETGPVSQDQLLARLDPFTDASGLSEMLIWLVDQGWITPGPDFQLTDRGRTHHTSILTAQKSIRQQAMQGITAEEYAMTIQVLQRMVANLQE